VYTNALVDKLNNLVHP